MLLSDSFEVANLMLGWQFEVYMKALFLAATLLSMSAGAETLLDCNPPMGSSLQEVRITREGDKVFRAELNFAGSFSRPVEISAAQWSKKNLRWVSPADGTIRLYQVSESGRNYWAYRASTPGTQVIGYCEE